MNLSDLIGKEFGYWTVLRGVEAHSDDAIYQKQRVHCRCRCGNERDVIIASLLSGRSKSCGCYHSERMHDVAYHDLTGQRFGMLTVVEDVGRKDRAILWKCMCDCGKYTTVKTADLMRKHVTSCGCYHQAKITKHGGTHEKLYSVWMGMRRRCSDPDNIGYKHYGGRGIKVCQEWDNDYAVFRDWAYTHGYNDTLTIDRIDSNGNYEPDNCRWITTREQCRNTRYNRYATIDGETKTIADWCDYYGITDKSRVYRRLKSGWDIIDALCQPPHRGLRHNSGVQKKAQDT